MQLTLCSTACVATQNEAERACDLITHAGVLHRLLSLDRCGSGLIIVLSNIDRGLSGFVDISPYTRYGIFHSDTSLISRSAGFSHDE